MLNSNAKIRLYVENDLKAGKDLLIEGNGGHYLVNVMRVKMGVSVIMFNGRDGDWLAEVVKVGKGKAKLTVRERIRQQQNEGDLWYLFAPIKKARTDYMVQKATELGVSLMRPVLTERTNLDKLKHDRLCANAIEAAEQCERMTVPKVEELIKLTELLEDWPEDRLLMFCDEEGEGAQNVYTIGRAINEAGAWQDHAKKWAILIGPEGGFTEEERTLLRKHHNVVPVTLGPRILRADTAAIAAIALWQSFAGDWA